MKPAARTTPEDETATAPTDGTPAVRLGALEAKVMSLLWDAGPATARQLQHALPAPTPASTTVLTVLTHLQEKGLVARERAGRAHRYQPVTSREDHLVALMHQTLASAPDPKAVLNRFLETVTH
jgi:predicted transcriptional regulator